MLKLLILATVALSIECATVVSSPQIKYCAYRESPYDDAGFGGDIEIFDNGTAKCTFYDDGGSSELTCMALFEVKNITRNGFNYSEEVEIKSQKCWAEPPTHVSGCLAPDECTGERRKRGNFSVIFCCCNEDYCNSDDKIGWVEPEEEIILTSPAPVKPDPILGYLIPFVVVFVLIVVFIVIIFYICRKKKLQQAEALQEKIKMYNYERRMYSDEPPLVNYDDMKLDNCLHRGRFGDVYRAMLNNEEVCVKYFHSQQRMLFLNEKEVFSVLNPDEKTVVQCLTCDERSHPDGAIQYIVIMEYVSLGALSSYLKTHTLTWRQLCSLAQSAAAGLGYLHSETNDKGVHKHAIVHRDINSRNILVRPDLTCAVADMGFAMKIRGSKIIRNGVEEHAEDGSLRDVGTVRYMAPEILDCAVNLKDCESSLKQIDVYAFSLVLWELLTRCDDLLYKKADADARRFMLPFEEELGTHPDFEKMRVYVAKEHHRPQIPINMRAGEATHLIRETIEECWDSDAEARLTALCVAERFKDVEALMEQKGQPIISMNDTYDRKKRLSIDNDIMISEAHELSPLIEQDTPASESNTTGVTPEPLKADVNIEMERDRHLGPRQGRNVVAERNTCRVSDDDLAVHNNKLMSSQEARARQAADEERSRRNWEDQHHQPGTNELGSGRPMRVSRPPARTVQLDVRNEVRDPNRVKENNLNRRRHSQHNLNESSTSSNGGNGVITLPAERPSRPKSLNLNIKPEDEC